MVISGLTLSSISIGTSTGPSAAHLAEAEAIRRSGRRQHRHAEQDQRSGEPPSPFNAVGDVR